MFMIQVYAHHSVCFVPLPECTLLNSILGATYVRFEGIDIIISD